MLTQLSSRCHKLSPKDRQVASNYKKLYFIELPGDLSLSKTVT